MTSGAVFNSDIHISGDVRIDDHAVIAPGVIILAAPDCSVAIAAGVCLGMGCILQAHQGNIEIHQGAMLGAGVLIVGDAVVGENACVGYGSTIFRASVLGGTVIQPNSLIGDTSRKVNTKPVTQSPKSSPSTPSAETDPWGAEVNQVSKSPTTISSGHKESISSPDETDSITPEITEVSPESRPDKQQDLPKEPVVGQVYINQLLMTLFPHNTPIKPPEPPSS
ncbi:transferase hexapeptide repeat containing protein [[Leptolyngbya] sp. PCC 7376]|uniref:transferase hexapeptide repeat containing protein n=1 Tax=[Leptolyngbya] sp. PCC 7376 TaxID=111781 RepID=UPI00029F37D3|nr:transferase hexapeptide repeat containing protein [[Leptolyngbya] sp. PCC 7376]AFY36622.1 transferase hexapeptide repeat containing protein [[Leptolyngbya] sp. PCC 7376]